MITIAGVAYPEMADSINPANLNNLPFTPDAFLGYVDGRWPDYVTIAAQHGGKPVYGLDVFGNATGDGTDSEPGNASIAQTVAATKADLARGVDRPIVYCPASWATAMVNAHTAAGIPRSKYRLVTAHYGGPTAAGAPIQGMHICGPATCGYGPGSDGAQWQSLDAYDRSLLAPDFITAAPHPGPAPAPAPILHKENTMVLANDGKAQYIITSDSVGQLRKHACPAGTNVQAIAASGTPNWGLQAQLLATIPAA